MQVGRFVVSGRKWWLSREWALFTGLFGLKDALPRNDTSTRDQTVTQDNNVSCFLYYCISE
jgi:hypothetical protein